MAAARYNSMTLIEKRFTENTSSKIAGLVPPMTSTVLGLVAGGLRQRWPGLSHEAAPPSGSVRSIETKGKAIEELT